MLTNRALEERTGATAFAATTQTVPTRKDLVARIAERLRQQPWFMFGTLYNVEFLEECDIRRTPVAGTAFETVNQVINDAGISTDGTVGGIMNALGIDKERIHSLLCSCHGDGVTGEELATRFEQIEA